MAKVSTLPISDVLTEDWGTDEQNSSGEGTGLPYSGKAVREALQEKLKKHDDSISSMQSDIETLQNIAATTTSYSATLTLCNDSGAKISAPDSVVVATQSYSVNLRYCSIASLNGETENAVQDGTLYIQLYDGTSWGTAISVQELTSLSTDSTGYVTVDIGRYFTTSTKRVRLYASFVDPDGATHSSSYITFGSVTYTALSLSYGGLFEDAYTENEISSSGFPLTFNLSAGVNCSLIVTTTSEAENSQVTASFDVTAGETKKTVYISGDKLSTSDLTSHGVKQINAYLYYNDELQSEEVNAQVMVDTGADDTPRLLVKDLISEADNYTTAKICEYALWARNTGETAQVTFSIRSGSTYYASREVAVVSGTSASLSLMPENESATGNFTAYFSALCEKKEMLWVVEDGQLVNGEESLPAISVNNVEGYTPTADSKFMLNPKNRSNSETNPFSIESGAGGTLTTYESEFSGFNANDSDLWYTDESTGESMLRVLAGQSVTIKYDWLAALGSSSASSVMLELDVRMRNVVDEETPILTACEEIGEDSYIGLKLAPLRGILRSRSTSTASSTDIQRDFRLQEDERTHIAISLLTNHDAGGADVMHVCRVYINGVINREFTYEKSTTEWYGSGSQIVIGQANADIDVFMIRCYNKALTESEVRQNYVSTIPAAADKQEFVAANAILSNEKVDYSACVAAGLNCLVWHGTQPSYTNQSSEKGYWEVVAFNADGTQDLDHSGTIGKGSASLKAKGQGTTAKTYYYWNLQTKIDDITDTITVNGCDLHEDYKSENYTDETMPADDEAVTVTDGWIDGNGKYRGSRFKLTADVPYATKLVNKINYASSMQSHIIGGNNLYNDLHKAIVGKNQLQLDYEATCTDGSEARVTKPLRQFLFFVQEAGDDAPVFQGPCAFGPGKMDAGTVGYNKKKHENFCLIEGADNNTALSDFRTPWDENNISAVVEEQSDGTYEVCGYSYGGVTGFDVDKFKSGNTITVGNVTASAPNEFVLGKIKGLVNFMYFHDTNIKVWDGTYTTFAEQWAAQEAASSKTAGEWAAEGKTYINERAKYWFATGDSAFSQYALVRYDIRTAAWVHAGFDVDSNTIQALNIHTACGSPSASSNARLNTAFIAAIADDALNGTLNGALGCTGVLSDHVKVDSLKFHYAFVNQLLAGSDNCSKNMYYALVPTDSDYSDYIWELWQDDVDTIFATDNNGEQTKPYYIDRQNPYEEGDEYTSLYEGSGNAMLNLVESLWGAADYTDNDGIVAMMNTVFKNMVELMGDVSSDNLPWIDSSYIKTPWGCLWHYFYRVQKTIPAAAYNAAAMVRYEYPMVAVKGEPFYTSARGVYPIVQSLGDQLQSELQYMKRRLVMFASYAKFGEFAGNSTYGCGLSEASAALSLMGKNSSTRKYSFQLVPHQYIYPSALVGTDNGHYLYTRCKPGETYTFAFTNSMGGDTAAALLGVNYYRELGDLGGMIAGDGNTNTVNLRGNRLVKLVVQNTGGFTPEALSVNAPLITSIVMTDVTSYSGSLDLRDCVRLTSIDTQGSAFSEVKFPETQTLTSISLGDNIQVFELSGQPNVASLSLPTRANLTTFEMSNVVSLNTRVWANRLYTEQPANLSSITFKGVSWSSDVTADMLAWLCGKGATLTGTITLVSASSDRYITLAEKLAMGALWKNIDSASNALYVSYDKLTATKCYIVGHPYLETATSETINLSYALFNGDVQANDILLGDDGLPAAVEWTFGSTTVGDEAYHIGDFGSIDASGVITVTDTSAAADKYRLPLSVAVQTLSATLEGEIKVGFFRRIPQIGDFAYEDGTFDSQYRPYMTLMGLVYKKDAITSGDETTGYTLRVVGNEDRSSGAVWGMYFSTSYWSTDEQSAIMEAYGASESSSITATGATQQSGSNLNITASYYRNSDAEDGYATLSHGALNHFGGKSDTEKIIAHSKALLKAYCGYTTIEQDFPKTTAELTAFIAELTSEKGLSTTQAQMITYYAACLCYVYEPTASYYALDSQYAAGEWYLPSEGELGRIYNFHLASAGDATSTTPSSENANEAEGLQEAYTPIFANAMKRMEDAAGSSSALGTVPLSTHWSSTENSSTAAWTLYFSSGGAYGSYGKYYSIAVRPVAAFTFEL